MRNAVVLLFCFILSSCATPKIATTEPIIFSTQIESGKVRVSPLPAIPWQDVSAKLQPNFSIKNADQVLPLVLPNTAASEYVNRSATAGGASLNLAGPARTKSTQVNTTTNLVEDEVTESSEIIESSRLISPAEVPTGNLAPALGVGIAAGIAEFKPSFDASLSYRAAAALYQEIQLLNTYLNASLSEADKVAYLFRIQITVDPSTRGQPINIDSRLWLDEPTCRRSTHPRTTASMREPGSEYCGSRDDIEIIPILIAENGERAANNRLVEAASQFESILSALVANQGIGAEFEQLKSELNALRGSDYNSLLNISLSSSQELLLNIGAAYSPTYGLEMRERTYDISFLVLLPRQVNAEGLLGVNTTFDSMQVYESATFVNALDGRTLPLIDQDYVDRFVDELDREMSVFRFSASARAEVAKLVTGGIVDDNVFDVCVDGSSALGCKSLGNFRSLYDRLRSYEDSLLPNSSKVVIPKQKRILPVPQNAFASDKSSAGITATLVAIPEFQLSNDFAAVLFATKKGAGKKTEEIAYPARKIELDGAGVIKLTFPSLADAGIDPSKSKAEIVLGFWDQSSDIVQRGISAKSTGTLPGKCNRRGQAVFELAPGSGRGYPVVFDLKNTAKPVTQKVYTVAIIPKSPTVSKDNETKIRVVLNTIAKTRVAIPVRVTVKTGALENVTHLGSTLKDQDPTKAPAGWNNLDARLPLNQFTGAHNNAYEVTISGVSKDMEIEIEIAQLKKDGTVDTEQISSRKFKTSQ